MRVAVLGGPADGARVRRGRTFSWIDFGTERAYDQPGPRRGLYRLNRDRKARRWVYEFVGHYIIQCAGCGSYRPDLPNTTCPLCGSPHPRRGDALPDG